MSEPHPSRHAFTGDISKHGKNPGTILRECREVSGEKARGKDLACKLQVAIAQHTRAAEFALDLYGIEQLCMEINSLSQQRVHVILRWHSRGRRHHRRHHPGLKQGLNRGPIVVRADGPILRVKGHYSIGVQTSTSFRF